MAGDSRLEAGRVLCDKWRLVAPLGEGGMASVWEGEHRNGRRVAIKILRPELSVDEDVRERFLREGYVANRVDHPGVVQVLDDDVTEDGLVLLVMELLEGISVKSLWLERERQLLPTEVVTIALGVLDVLAVAHRAGIVHRDVKPDNVFVVHPGMVKVLDFGIARLREIDVVDQRTKTGTMLGTPAFMPPEQALGHWDQVDHRSDLFAVGATMWTLLTGALIHSARTVQELLVKVSTQPVRPIAERMPDLDPRLGVVIDRALAYRREDRWADAAAMRAALAELEGDATTNVMEHRPEPSVESIGAHGSWKTLLATVPTPRPITGVPLPFPSSETAGPTTQLITRSKPRSRSWLLAGVVGATLGLVGIGWALWLAPDPGATEIDGPTTSSSGMEEPTEPTVDSGGPGAHGAARPTAEAPAKPDPSSSATAVVDTERPDAGTPPAALPPRPPSRPPAAPPPRPPPPPLPVPAPAPTLDCGGEDFNNPACAR